MSKKPHASDAEVFEIAKKVADQELAPRANRYDKTGEFPMENVKALGKSGLMGLLVPKRYGGMGGTIFQFARVSEILAKACPSTSMVWGMHTNQYIILVDFGTEEQKKKILTGIAKGTILIASASTEPGTGGNFFYCHQAVKRNGNGWEYTAVKPVVTSAPYADYVFCFVKTSPETVGTDVSFFMVPCKAKGVSVIGSWDTFGLRATQSLGLKFEEVKLNKFNLLGPLGGFGEMALRTLAPICNIGFAGVWLGAAQAAFDRTVNHIKKRIHHFAVPGDEKGHTVASYESVHRQVAEMSVLLNQTRSFLNDVAISVDEARPATDKPMPIEEVPNILDTSTSLRITSGENAIAITTTALRIAGAQGYRKDFLFIDHCHRDVLASQVMSPAPDSMKVFLGKLKLGLSIEEASRYGK
jgi:alkylation response protein AidB-like acyl-CoA dehydrogenase